MAEKTDAKPEETPPPALAELSPDDIFEQAFAQLSEAVGEDQPISKAIPGAKPEPKEEPKEEPKDEDEGLPPDDKEVKGETKTPAPKPETKTLDPKPELSDDELARRLAALVGRTEPAPQPQPQPEATLYTPEDQKFLGEYMKEYPDIARGEFLRRRAEYAGLVEYVFGEVSKVVGPRLEMLETLLQRTHLGDIKTVVPDYDNTLRERVVEWADKQPPYLKAAYAHVINQGTVDEVKDLIARYQADTGQARPVVAPAPPVVPPVPPAKTLDPKVARAAAALAPVASKASGRSTSAIDPTDFDSAFDAFSKQLANV